MWENNDTMADFAVLRPETYICLTDDNDENIKSIRHKKLCCKKISNFKIINIFQKQLNLKLKETTHKKLT